MGCWHGYLSVWVCYIDPAPQNADLHMVQLMPLPLTVSCFSKIQIGFTFLVPAHPGSPGKKGHSTRVCVYSNWLTRVQHQTVGRVSCLWLFIGTNDDRDFVRVDYFGSRENVVRSAVNEGKWQRSAGHSANNAPAVDDDKLSYCDLDWFSIDCCS